MSESDLPRDETFEVWQDLDSLSAEGAFEGVNVCRVVALASLFGPGGRASLDLAAELEMLGFSGRLLDRPAEWENTGRDWYLTVEDGSDGERLERWMALNESPTRSAARAFALTLLVSPLERESAAAAAFLWRQLEEDGLTKQFLLRRSPWYGFFREYWWSEDRVGGLFADLWAWSGFRDPEADEEPSLSLEEWRYLVLDLPVLPRRLTPLQLSAMVRWRLELARRSGDPIQQSFAAAVLFPYSRGVHEESGERQPETDKKFRPDSVSTMIHGTWGWKGRWWRPRGDFHDFILNNHRSDLYARGAHYSWSGGYSAKQRRLAGEDFCGWAVEMAPGGIHSLFAHSYGGEVAARAWLSGTHVDDLVLLSTPVNDILHAAARSGARIIDVRLRFDPVLALARDVGQRLPALPNVTPVLLTQWRLDHAATHNPDVWGSEGIAARANL